MARLVVWVLAALLSGRGEAAAPAVPGVKVPTAWVGAHGREITLVDVRDPSAYRRGHLDGAINVRWRAFSDPRAPYPGNLDPDRARIARDLEALGIGTDRPVAVYSDPPNNWGEEGRIFWMLELLGHRAVTVMDGGFPRWVAEGRQITTAVPAPRPGARFTLAPNPDRLIGADEIHRRLLDPSLRIVDTRTPAEFAGATPYGERRGGRIPGAVNLHWSDCLTADGLLRGPEALMDLMRRRRIDRAGEQALYCTGGVRSGFVYWVLRGLGYPKARNYDGSFWEWASRDDLPVER